MSDQYDIAPRLVIGIGASAGGLDAFRRLLDAPPADTGMAFVLVQYLSPSHKSRLPELLSAATSMNVQEAEHGVQLRPDSVYVTPPAASIAVRGGRVELVEDSHPVLPKGGCGARRGRWGGEAAEGVSRDGPTKTERKRPTDRKVVGRRYRLYCTCTPATGLEPVTR